MTEILFSNVVIVAAVAFAAPLALGFVLSLDLALAGGYALTAAGQVRSPLFIGIVLAATALGLVAPILKEEGLSEGEFGQLVLAAATIADFGTVILLSLLFSRNAGSVGSRLALLGSRICSRVRWAGLETPRHRSVSGGRCCF